VNGSQWSDGRDVEQIGPEMALYENGAPFFDMGEVVASHVRNAGQSKKSNYRAEKRRTVMVSAGSPAR
jgi:hypothetical protein